MNADQSSFKNATSLSTDQVIAVILDQRNTILANLLQNEVMAEFLEEQYDTFVISPVKKEFLIRDLKTLRDSSLDLVHYASLIKSQQGMSSATTGDIHPLFIHEIKSIFAKYGFGPK